MCPLQSVGRSVVRSDFNNQSKSNNLSFVILWMELKCAAVGGQRCSACFSVGVLLLFSGICSKLFSSTSSPQSIPYARALIFISKFPGEGWVRNTAHPFPCISGMFCVCWAKVPEPSIKAEFG